LKAWDQSEYSLPPASRYGNWAGREGRERGAKENAKLSQRDETHTQGQRGRGAKMMKHFHYTVHYL
jgi:hypothetical protein